MGKKATPKQKKLIRLLPRVEAGELTMQQAMLDAGYSESTAREQSEVLGQIGKNEAFQKALEKAGATDEFIANELMGGVKELGHGPVKLAYIHSITRLRDMEPSKKVDLKHSGSVRVGLGEIVDNADDEDDEEEIDLGEDEEEVITGGPPPEHTDGNTE